MVDLHPLSARLQEYEQSDRYCHLVAVSLYIMILVWRKQLLTRAGGVSMLAIYAAYMVYICVREVL